MTSVRRLQRLGVAALAGVVLATGGSAVAAAAAPATGAQITTAERDEIVAQHNRFRAEVRQAPLTWDPAIAASAQRWAEAKQADGVFAHSPNGSRPGLGENLAGGDVKDATIRLAEGTPSERALYQANPQPVDQPPGNWMAWGHYSQIVWSSTTRVGCGFAPPGRLAFGLVVCQYGPPGNFNGQFPYPPDTVLVPQPGLNPVGAPAPAPPPGAPPAVEAPPVVAPPAAGTPPAGNPPPADVPPPAVVPPAGNPPPAVVPPAADTGPAGIPPATGAAAGCADADTPVASLSRSATAAAVRCLITGARKDAGLADLGSSAPLGTVATGYAQNGQAPPFGTIVTDLGAAGYCAGGFVSSARWASFSSGSATPHDVFNHFSGGAIVTAQPPADLGVGVAGGTSLLLLAACG